ncbi:MAG TPA: hypothetical protein VM513_28665, partial [Kofleriaceae bacterium]|nr:hypothetical protein [Kofleriaceae bacterium]
MRVAHILLVALLAGCYEPSPPEGAPCTSAGSCPSPLVCDQGLCVRTPRDASVRDAARDAAAIDAKGGKDQDVDAAMAITTFGPGNHTY